MLMLPRKLFIKSIVIYFHKIDGEAMNLPKTSDLHTDIVIQD